VTEVPLYPGQSCRPSGSTTRAGYPPPRRSWPGRPARSRPRP